MQAIWNNLCGETLCDFRLYPNTRHFGQGWEGRLLTQSAHRPPFALPLSNRIIDAACEGP